MFHAERVFFRFLSSFELLPSQTSLKPGLQNENTRETLGFLTQSVPLSKGPVQSRGLSDVCAVTCKQCFSDPAIAHHLLRALEMHILGIISRRSPGFFLLNKLQGDALSSNARDMPLTALQ